MLNRMYIKTVIGTYIAEENGAGITRLELLCDSSITDYSQECKPTLLLKECESELKAYFDGRLKKFSVPVSLHGTEFQKKVWHTLQQIPYGETRSYGEIAECIGSPKACRAVGSANNHNPVAIIVPCHRVIGANGKLVGYAGGLDVKKYLLDLEKKYMGCL